MKGEKNTGLRGVYIAGVIHGESQQVPKRPLGKLTPPPQRTVPPEKLSPLTQQTLSFYSS